MHGGAQSKSLWRCRSWSRVRRENKRSPISGLTFKSLKVTVFSWATQKKVRTCNPHGFVLLTQFVRKCPKVSGCVRWVAEAIFLQMLHGLQVFY